MGTPVYIVPPIDAHARRAREVLTREGFVVREFGEPVPEDSSTLLFVLSLIEHPEHVLHMLKAFPSSSKRDELYVVLVTPDSLSFLPEVAKRGLCITWSPDEREDLLPERVRAVLAAHDRLYRAHRVRAMIPLYALAQSFADMEDLSVLLHRILDTAIREVGADRGSVMLLDESERVLYVAAAIGLPEQAMQQRQRVGEGIAGWVAKVRRPLILTEGQIPEFVHPWLRRRNAYSSISIPMVHAGNLLGVLNLTKHPGRQPFKEGDAEVAGILAAQAAALIHNARLYVELQRAYRDLQQLDRLRTQIIDIAAHELRTPVTVIKGYLELIAEMEIPEIHPYLSPIMRHLARLEALARDLFDLHTLRSLEKEPQPRLVTVAEWLKEAVVAPYVELIARKNQSLEVDIDPSAEQLVFDPDHVAAILRHLLSNAVKFTPEGGQIALRVRREGKEAVFHVDDSGPGIPIGERKRVFQGFYQSEDVSTREHEGLGIGLTLAQALAHAHGGTITIGDSPLGGARVSVRIPS